MAGWLSVISRGHGLLLATFAGGGCLGLGHMPREKNTGSMGEQIVEVPRFSVSSQALFCFPWPHIPCMQATNSRKHKRRLITPDQAPFHCAASTIDSAWFRHDKIGFSVGAFHFKVNPVPIGAQALGNEMKTIGHGHA